MTDAQKIEILRLRSQNVPFAQIAPKMGISKSTIKSYCQRQAQKSAAVDNAPKCAHCGKALVQLPHKKPKKFCCDRCRYAYYYQRGASTKKYVCAYCGAEFEARGSANRKYCSVKCYNDARWGVAGR